MALLQQLEEQQQILLHPFSLCLLLFVSLFILRRLSGAWTEKLNLPPSPPKLPIIGNLHQLGTLPHRSLQALSQKYGPLMLLHLGHASTLVVSSAEMAGEILKTHDIDFANRHATTAAKAVFYGCVDVGFSPFGEYWRQVRKICVHELLSINRVQSFKFVREEEVSLMMEKISRSCSMGAPINLTEMLLSLSNNIISMCALGMKPEGEDGKNKFGELSRDVLGLFGAFSFGDFFPLLGWMDVLTGLVPKLRRASQELDIFFDGVIDEHLISRKHVDQDDKRDFVDVLLHIQKDNKLTRDNIKALLLDMFFAGTDSTSTTIEWAFAELVKNPSVMKKAQEEIRGVVGKKSKVDEEDIHQMDYLTCIVKETLRLHAPLSMLVPRESTAISTNVKGYLIPPKTRVLINVWAIQRDPKLWDSPEEFRPERFINNSIDFKGKDLEFIPFGSGRRGCPGISFGLTVTQFVLANLLYCFDWELPGGANKEELDMTEAFGITVNKRIPLDLVPIYHSF